LEFASFGVTRTALDDEYAPNTVRGTANDAVEAVPENDKVLVDQPGIEVVSKVIVAVPLRPSLQIVMVSLDFAITADAKLAAAPPIPTAPAPVILTVTDSEVIEVEPALFACCQTKYPTAL